MASMLASGHFAGDGGGGGGGRGGRRRKWGAGELERQRDGLIGFNRAVGGLLKPRFGSRCGRLVTAFAESLSTTDVRTSLPGIRFGEEVAVFASHFPQGRDCPV